MERSSPMLYVGIGLDSIGCRQSKSTFAASKELTTGKIFSSAGSRDVAKSHGGGGTEILN